MVGAVVNVVKTKTGKCLMIMKAQTREFLNYCAPDPQKYFGDRDKELESSWPRKNRAEIALKAPKRGYSFGAKHSSKNADRV